jgi:hypothetical protein
MKRLILPLFLFGLVVFASSLMPSEAWPAPRNPYPTCNCRVEKGRNLYQYGVMIDEDDCDFSIPCEIPDQAATALFK